MATGVNSLGTCWAMAGAPMMRTAARLGAGRETGFGHQGV